MHRHDHVSKSKTKKCTCAEKLAGMAMCCCSFVPWSVRLENTNRCPGKSTALNRMSNQVIVGRPFCLA